MTQTIELSGITLTVDYDYSEDPGCYYTKNGDGWPPTEELIITDIRTDGNICDLLDSFDTVEKIYDRLEEIILPYARDNYKN